MTAVKNVAVDMLRKERREEALPEDWDPPAPETGETDYRYLVSLIRALPESYRRVLELKCMEEESNREIARRLGLKGVHRGHPRPAGGGPCWRRRWRRRGTSMDERMLRHALMEANLGGSGTCWTRRRNRTGPTGI